jgi:hypothetical protein
MFVVALPSSSTVLVNAILYSPLAVVTVYVPSSLATQLVTL